MGVKLRPAGRTARHRPRTADCQGRVRRSTAQRRPQTSSSSPAMFRSSSPRPSAPSMEFHSTEHAAMTILTADPSRSHRLRPRPPQAARVHRSPRHRRAERPQARRPSPMRSTPVSTASRPLRSSSNLERLTDQNASGEFYLTDIASLLVSEGKRVVGHRCARSR